MLKAEAWHELIVGTLTSHKHPYFFFSGGELGQSVSDGYQAPELEELRGFRCRFLASDGSRVT